jgi:sugar-specific transcriptional regulator TrmB
MLKEKLTKLNLTNNQTETYLALLELGESKVGPIIKKTNFHRNIVYQSLEELIQKRLVSKVTKRGVFYFNLLDPEAFLNKIKKQEAVAQEVIKEIKSQSHPFPSEITVLSGKKSILNLYDIILEQEKDVYLIGATFQFSKEFAEKIPILKKEKEKKGIIHYAIAQADTRQSQFTNTVDQIRFLPKTFPPSPHVIWISGNIIGHIIWENPPIAILIKNKKIAENYREYFKVLWKISKP